MRSDRNQKTEDKTKRKILFFQSGGRWQVYNKNVNTYYD